MAPLLAPVAGGFSGFSGAAAIRSIADISQQNATADRRDFDNQNIHPVADGNAEAMMPTPHPHAAIINDIIIIRQ